MLKRIIQRISNSVVNIDEISAELGVNRSEVQGALQLLWSLGYLNKLQQDVNRYGGCFSEGRASCLPDHFCRNAEARGVYTLSEKGRKLYTRKEKVRK